MTQLFIGLSCDSVPGKYQASLNHIKNKLFFPLSLDFKRYPKTKLTKIYNFIYKLLSEALNRSNEVAGFADCFFQLNESK